MQEVYVRPWKPGDSTEVWAVLREASFSNLWPSFKIALGRTISQCTLLAVCLICIGTGVSIIAAVLWLASFVAVVYLCCFGATVYFLYGPNFNDMKHMESSYFASPFNHFWVAEVAGEVVGTIAVISKQNGQIITMDGRRKRNGSTHNTTGSGIAVKTGENCKPQTAWLRRMAVKKTFRGRGIAKLLVQTVIYFCRQQGYETIFLITTEVHQPARALYASMGFKQKAFIPYKHLGGLISVWTYEFELTLT